MRVIRRFFRKQFSPIIILLSLFLNIFSPFVSLLPKSVARAQEVNEVAPSVSLSFDFPSNNFVMKAQGVNHASYALKYSTKEGKDVGVEDAEANLEEKIFAGTCSKDDCVKDIVSSGQFSFEGVFEDMRVYKKVISFKVVDGVFWTSDTSKWSTNDVVLGHVYKAPQNDNVSVTFTKLPEKPGNLSIEEINLSDEQVKSIGALSNVAYDITSDMNDGEFEYTLTLPNTEKDAVVLYAEEPSKLTTQEAVIVTDVKQSEEFVRIPTLNHFTTFIVVMNPGTPPPVTLLQGVIDNGDPEYSEVGAWSNTASCAANSYGLDGRYATNVGGVKTATWQFTVPTTGCIRWHFPGLNIVHRQRMHSM